MNRNLIALAPLLFGVISGISVAPQNKKNPIQMQRRPALFSSFTVDAQSISEGSVLEHTAFGIPTLLPATQAHYGLSALVQYRGYTALQSASLKLPLWVCEKVTKEQLDPMVDRHSSFKYDPTFPRRYQARLPDYTNSGFDKGHMAPSANHTVSHLQNVETFYWTNVVPQEGGFNSHVWGHLESKIRQVVTSDSPVYIITGPMFYDPAEDPYTLPTFVTNEQVHDGLVEHLTIGSGGVSVPTHLYKIILQEKGNVIRTLAFVFENRSGYIEPSRYNYSDNITSIDWVEERTGIDFFPDLDEQKESQLESNVSENWIKFN